MVGQRADVSVVIPAYNSGHTIERAIQSVISDPTTNKELIVVDDGSEDDTLNVVERLVPIIEQPVSIKVFTQPNAGACTARNRGLAEASGRFIQFLDADDELCNGKLAHSLRAFEQNPALVCVYTNGGTQGKANQPFEAAHENLNLIADLDFDEFTFGMNTNMPVFRRSFIISSGERWDTSLACWQEADFFFRLMLHSGGSKNIQHLPCTGFIRHPSQSGIGAQHNQKWYIQSKINAVRKIHRRCADFGLDNPSLRAQHDRFLWLAYKQSVVCGYDDLLGELRAQYGHQTWLQRLVYAAPPSLLRLANKLS